MKLTINNTNERVNNVANHAGPAIVAAAEPAIVDADFEEVKDKPVHKPKLKRKVTLKRKSGNKEVTGDGKNTERYFVSTYQTKKGGTASLLFGFSSQEETVAMADRMAKSVGVTWRYSATGERRYCLALGTRYGRIAADLCDALNRGDRAAVSKAVAASHDVYALAVSDGKAERERKNAERKAQREEARRAEKRYSQKDLAALLKKIMDGGDVPEEVKKLMEAA